MFEGLGLMLLGVVLIACGLIGHYHPSWKSGWQMVAWGLVTAIIGAAMIALSFLLAK